RAASSFCTIAPVRRISPPSFDCACTSGAHRLSATATATARGLDMRPPLSVEHDDAAWLGVGAAAHEVHAGGEPCAAVVGAVPGERLLARGEHAIREAPHAAPADVVHVHLHAARPRHDHAHADPAPPPGPRAAPRPP